MHNTHNEDAGVEHARSFTKTRRPKNVFGNSITPGIGSYNVHKSDFDRFHIKKLDVPLKQ